MAFDQNSIPKDLRPLNIPRTLPEEIRIAPVSSSGRNPEGLHPNLPHISSAASISPNYPATLADVGFTGVGYSNMSLGAAGWYPVMPTSVHSGPGGNLTSGICHIPNSGARIGGSASDQASDEGGEDSVSGKKVKFLCSFGGKILPRPSDGMLRYVGGQMRIISVRRDVSFGEIVQKMVDVCGQIVIIKYQLPDEDLDALVSVSCPDDLENMMDEYEKLANRSSDGSAKLRVFLFSLSELDASGMVHFGELQDSGQRYVEAVNGIINGVSVGIARKESIASAASTQNSDLSGTEALDFSSPIQGDITGPASTGTLSPKANSTTPRDPSPRVVPVDPRLVVDSEASVTPLGVPLNQSGPQAVISHPEHELERPVPVTPQQQQVGSEYQQLGFNIRPPAPYLDTFVDPHQEIANRVDYVQVPSQIGFPAQVMGTIGPVYTHPQFHDNATGVSSQHYIPAMHMTMAPPSHVSIRPNVVLPVMQTQQVRSETRPDDGQSGATVFHLPVGQSYHAYAAQVPPSVIGGGYGWHQVPQPEQVVFSEGWLPHQQAMISEKIPRFNGCYMCEKSLPHAHSDTMVQDQRGSIANPVVDSTSVYHNLRFEDKIRAEPMSRVVVSGALGEGGVEQQGAGAHQNILGHIDQEVRKSQLGVAGATRSAEHQYDNDRINLHKVDNLDHPKASFPLGVVGLPVGGQPPYAAVMGTYSQPSHENAPQQYAVPTQNQYKQETLLNKPVNNDLFRGGGMLQMSDHLVHELPNEYSGKLLTAPKEGTPDSYDHLREINGRLENLRVCPPEVLASNDKCKPPMDNTRQEVPTESQKQQISAKEPYLEDTFIKPSIEFDPNYLKANEMLPSLNDVSYVHTSRPLETCEAAKPPLLSNPTAYQQSMLGINHLAPYEGSHGNHTFAGVDSVHIAERIQSAVWTVDPSQLQPKLLPTDLDIAASSGNPLVSLSPVHGVIDVQDSSNSLFSNQDPWDLQHDSHFPPPLPSKIAIRKEGLGTRAPFDENQMFNYGEVPNSNSGASIAEVRLEDGFLQAASNIEVDFGSEHTRTTQGSAEEMIKRELQGVAEGVAASVLKSSMPSDPDLTKLERKETVCEAIQDTKVRNDVEIEEMKSKLPEKTNFGFPVSDGIGRLQIVNNSDLEELRELGSGTFGTVYHGKWRGTDVAIKRINDRCFAGKPSEQERMRDDFWNEAIKLADLHHPNVVAFYGVVLDGPGGSVATVTEYMVNGSLRNALQKNERNLDKRKRLLIAMDVAFGMEYLHGKNIVHFDLKSDNLLVNLRDPHRPICKVGDLGLSKVKCRTLISGGVRGTLPWMAPELLNGSSSLVSEKVDVFSFGIVMWELLTGEEPYADLHYGAIIGGIVSNTLRPSVPESCDSEWRTLMEICWSAEPSERPSFTEIANELRSMAARIPPKAQNQQQAASTQPQAKS